LATAEHPRGAGSPFRKPYIYFALLIPALALAFAKSYFASKTFSGKSLTVLVHVHTALMLLWLVMLIAQALFIRARRFRLHRWVGRSSYVIVPVIIVAAVVATHESLNRSAKGITAEVAQLEVTTWGQLLPFAITWGLAILYRRRTALHVRFMVSTAFAIGTAVVFRILLSWVPGLDNLDHVAAANWAVLTLLLLALIVADWRMGVKRSPYWVVTVLIALMHIGYWTFATTDGWFAFVQWFADLPL
jgi:hypothetical protein